MAKDTSRPRKNEGRARLTLVQNEPDPIEQLLNELNAAFDAAGGTRLLRSTKPGMQQIFAGVAPAVRAILLESVMRISDGRTSYALSVVSGQMMEEMTKLIAREVAEEFRDAMFAAADAQGTTG